MNSRFSAKRTLRASAAGIAEAREPLASNVFGVLFPNLTPEFGVVDCSVGGFLSSHIRRASPAATRPRLERFFFGGRAIPWWSVVRRE